MSKRKTPAKRAPAKAVPAVDPRIDRVERAMNALVTELQCRGAISGEPLIRIQAILAEAVDGE